MATNPGALVVFIEPGPETTEDEFNEMYEQDHIPPRLALEEFTGGYRMKAIDGEKPTWGGLFIVSEVGIINAPPVAQLLSYRSERELRISSAYAGLDRRAYKLIYDSADDAKMPKKKIQPMIVITVGVSTTDSDALHAYYDEEHVEMLSMIPGWVRTRRYEFILGGVAGPLMDGKVAPSFLSVVEFANEASLLTEEFKVATTTPRRDELMKNITLFEKRTFKVFKVLTR